MLDLVLRRLGSVCIAVVSAFFRFKLNFSVKYMPIFKVISVSFTDELNSSFVLNLFI